ncbi:hypothetical protein B0T17DRAFT_533270 [Bombardia bombarda]|uniref:Uncharacterized protein n=1 Tax=Bombardia bombarda TaxID=252184 RepID=A0AA39WTU4_9PEZI|nr:hypothetical protein B0T17DRAFT_533270 [Bombardia bombarda]
MQYTWVSLFLSSLTLPAQVFRPNPSSTHAIPSRAMPASSPCKPKANNLVSPFPNQDFSQFSNHNHTSSNISPITYPSTMHPTST